MKQLLSILAGIFFLATCSFSQGIDYMECIKKTSSEWGGDCIQCPVKKDTYRVFLKNNCSESVDVKIAVMETIGRFRTFTFSSVLPNDSVSGYACTGNGKYFFWAKKTGDKSLLFPDDEEIQRDYGN